MAELKVGSGQIPNERVREFDEREKAIEQIRKRREDMKVKLAEEETRRSGLYLQKKNLNYSFVWMIVWAVVFTIIAIVIASVPVPQSYQFLKIALLIISIPIASAALIRAVILGVRAYANTANGILRVKQQGNTCLMLEIEECEKNIKEYTKKIAEDKILLKELRDKNMELREDIKGVKSNWHM